ncbi:endonuclease/exonuclease/phosphatase family protein [Shewanella marina]|uniref:endonuclease/exonuclease/phosphatase family protein n=1 Tax=Shewanella marina TaxID=487319 RepID=UPI00046F365D|nr:endonuclease/exonuclease/phosphatase family protein [Shewanella marina]
MSPDCPALTVTSSTPTSFQCVVATLNLFNFLAPPDAYYQFDNIYTEQQWQKKCAWLTRFIERIEPDILGLQEVFSIAELQQLLTPLGYPYFACVDQPQIHDEFIYTDPVVAVASKYPITAVERLKPSIEQLNLLNLAADFDFSRAIVRATIRLPLLGEVDCYVLHFKSKRPTSLQHEHLLAQGLGRWLSDKRRGDEAALLSLMIHCENPVNRAVLVMGDFNDELISPLLTPLLADTQLALQDSFSLFQQGYIGLPLTRIPTHYYGANGMVLDYILLSKSFNPQASCSIAEVTDYCLYDQHLIAPQYALDSHSSDHAAVVITINSRS